MSFTLVEQQRKGCAETRNPNKIANKIFENYLNLSTFRVVYCRYHFGFYFHAADFNDEQTCGEGYFRRFDFKTSDIYFYWSR